MISLSAEIYPIGEDKPIKISNRSLINIDFSGQDRSDISLPSWGIKSNSGYLEMYDTDGTIENLKKQELLANSKINIYLNTSTRKEQVGGFYVTNVNKDRQTLKAKIEFEDILMSWERKKIDNVPLKINVSAYDFLFLFLSPNDLIFYDTQSENMLKNIILSKPYLEGGSLWSAVTKMCETCMLYVSCNNIGKPSVKYNGGR